MVEPLKCQCDAFPTSCDQDVDGEDLLCRHCRECEACHKRRRHEQGQRRG